jgi:hypothetical protein
MRPGCGRPATIRRPALQCGWSRHARPCARWRSATLRLPKRFGGAACRSAGPRSPGSPRSSPGWQPGPSHSSRSAPIRSPTVRHRLCAIVALVGHSVPERSAIRLALTAASVLLLPVLARAKLRLASPPPQLHPRADGILSLAGAALAAVALAQPGARRRARLVVVRRGPRAAQRRLPTERRLENEPRRPRHLRG